MQGCHGQPLITWRAMQMQIEAGLGRDGPTLPTFPSQSKILQGRINLSQPLNPSKLEWWNV